MRSGSKLCGDPNRVSLSISHRLLHARSTSFILHGAGCIQWIPVAQDPALQGFWGVVLRDLRLGSATVLRMSSAAILDTGTSMIVGPYDDVGYLASEIGAQCVKFVSTEEVNYVSIWREGMDWREEGSINRKVVLGIQVGRLGSPSRPGFHELMSDPSLPFFGRTAHVRGAHKYCACFTQRICTDRRKILRRL